MFEKEKIRRLKEATKAWEGGPLRDYLNKRPEKKESFSTDVGLDIERVNTPVHLSELGFDYERDLGLPGAFLN